MEIMKEYLKYWYNLAINISTTININQLKFNTNT